MKTRTMSTRRFRAIIAALFLVIGLMVTGGGAVRAQQATPIASPPAVVLDDLPVAIHAGDCAAPVAEPEYDLGHAVAFGTGDDEDDDDDSDDVRGAAPATPPLFTDEDIEATFDDVVDSPHVIAVHQSEETFGTLVACGAIGGIEEDGRIVMALRPVGGSGLAGIAILNEDEEGVLGIGEDEIQVEVYLIPDVTAEPGAGVAPAPVAEGENRVDVALTEFVIDMPTSILAGEVTFVVTNSGAIEHNFEIEGEGIEEEFAENLQPGETRELTLDLEPGTYEVYCPVGNHEDEGMALELTVTG